MSVAMTDLSRIWSPQPRIAEWGRAIDLMATRLRRLNACLNDGRLTTLERHQLSRAYAEGLAAARLRAAGQRKVSTVRFNEDVHNIISAAVETNKQRKRDRQEERRQAKLASRLLALSQLEQVRDRVPYVPPTRTVKIKPERGPESLAQFYAIYDRQQAAEKAAAEHFAQTVASAAAPAQPEWIDN